MGAIQSSINQMLGVGAFISMFSKKPGNMSETPKAPETPVQPASKPQARQLPERDARGRFISKQQKTQEAALRTKDAFNANLAARDRHMQFLDMINGEGVRSDV